MGFGVTLRNHSGILSLAASVTIVTLLALFVPRTARAVDCSKLPDPVVGQPWTAEQLECLRAAVVATDRAAAVCDVERRQCRTYLDACEATAEIVAPEPPLPVVPVAIAGLVGVVVGVVLALFVGVR